VDLTAADAASALDLPPEVDAFVVHTGRANVGFGTSFRPGGRESEVNLR
jgi:hypothetical protein